MCGRGLYDILTLIFNGLSAVGTVGAVMFSLWVLFDSKKIKYKMKADTVTMLDTNGESIIGINVTLTNNSKDNLIKISSFPKIRISKNSYMIYEPNLQSYNGYKLGVPLSYGDSLNFFIDQKQIKLTLENDNKIFLFFFNDNLGHTFKIKIKRELFEKQNIIPTKE